MTLYNLYISIILYKNTIILKDYKKVFITIKALVV
jgi:hypothetical protein